MKRSRVGWAILGVLAVALISAAVSWGVFEWRSEDLEEDPGSGASGPVNTGSPAAVDEDTLTALAASIGPLYWAGPIKGTTTELTVTPDGATFIRYLPDGVDPGSEDPFLTVATYRFVNGYAELQALGEEDGSTVVQGQSGALIVTRDDAPDSVYFSFPGAAFQVEVFSPVEGEALDLTESGAIRLVGSTG